MTTGGRRASRSVSRRHFLRKAAAGASVAMAGAGTTDAHQRPTAASLTSTLPTASVPTLRIPLEFAAAAQTAPAALRFPMTGAQVFAQARNDEGVAALFCCPGNYGVIHALAGIGLPTFSGRHEGVMTHAADAFIRVTGEIAAASCTEGPGLPR